MKTKSQIEDELANLCDKYDQNADTWNEAAMATLDWVIGNNDTAPSAD